MTPTLNLAALRAMLAAATPCPFCGRADLLDFEPKPTTGYVAVMCRVCGAHGPAGRSSVEDEQRTAALGLESEAIAHWNRRAVTVGAIRIERVLGGPNIRILKTHTPSEQIVIEGGDFEDLMVALDATLQHWTPDGSR